MKATIIGAGNLGGAIACGLAKGSFIGAENITCVDPNQSALERLRATGFAFNLTSDLHKSIPGADIIILAVKPDLAQETIAEFRSLIDYRRQIIFSGIGGVSFTDLCRYLFEEFDCSKGYKPECILFRIITNISISIRESMTFISTRNANAAQIKLAEAIFGEMGQTMFVPESLLSAGMAVSSCGIAYAMRFVRAMMAGAIELGFNAAEARDIVLHTVKGATNLLIDNGQHPEVEIDRVATRGGYTIKGLNAMEERGFSSSVVAGIRESCKNAR